MKLPHWLETKSGATMKLVRDGRVDVLCVKCYLSSGSNITCLEARAIHVISSLQNPVMVFRSIGLT